MSTSTNAAGWALFQEMQRLANHPTLKRLWPNGIPPLCDDEGEMGESDLHTRTCDILFYGLDFHFMNQVGRRVFGNLNLYHSQEDPRLFVAPDIMVVESAQLPSTGITSYRIGQEGPVPLAVIEVLSPRTFQESDLTNKPILYARIGVQEYILVDVSGELLPGKLLLLRRQPDGTWLEMRDAGGGVTSQLGFRLMIDAEGQLRVIDIRSGKPYPRPQDALAAIEQAHAEAQARHQAEERVKALEEELARLRGNGPKQNGV